MPDQANNVTAHQVPAGYLSDSFDHTAIWEEQGAPLVKQLHALCQKHDIPFFMVALYQLEDKGDRADSSMTRAAYFPGPHRVPHRFVMIDEMFGDPEYAEIVERMTQMHVSQRPGADDSGELEA